MEQIFSNFGVKPILLSAQIVNFLILFLILRKLLYKPILQLLEERKQNIEKNIRNAEQIKKQLINAEQAYSAKIAEANIEAQKIVATASDEATAIIAKAHQQAQYEVDLMIKKAKENLLHEKDKARQVMHKEYANLVILGIETITSEVLQLNDHKKIIESRLKELNDQNLN
jgi:F-type H+-transporting ATPase subunit b